MERTILHIDANSFYASVTCLYHTELRCAPVAICGDPEARHGIVLTSNRLAHRQGVRTGMAVWQASQLCPALKVVRPDYPLYIHLSEQLRQIYEQYSDRVENFGLDECWVDVSASERSAENCQALADEIRLRVREELGLTVSVGASFNKVFAKLGSDLQKPDAVTLLPRSRMAACIWPLPVQQLLFVGPRTTRKLRDMGITTIGELAGADTLALDRRIGKNGVALQAFARGEDDSPVMPVTMEAAIKSIGNSITTPHDVSSESDARCIFHLLAENVGERLRTHGFRTRCVSISLRTTELEWSSRQVLLKRPTSASGDIIAAAMALFLDHGQRMLPLRSVGIACSMLSPEADPVQLDVNGSAAGQLKHEQLDHAIDGLRRRYGHQMVRRGVELTDAAFAGLCPVEDHTVHPVSFYTG